MLIDIELALPEAVHKIYEVRHVFKMSTEAVSYSDCLLCHVLLDARAYINGKKPQTYVPYNYPYNVVFEMVAILC